MAVNESTWTETCKGKTTENGDHNMVVHEDLDGVKRNTTLANIVNRVVSPYEGKNIEVKITVSVKVIE